MGGHLMSIELQRIQDMRLLIYAPPASDVGRNLRKSLHSFGFEAGNDTAFCPSLASLDKQLRKPLGRSPVGILIPGDDDDLAALIGMRHLLRDMRLILILPTGLHPNMTRALAQAHMLRPRFVTQADKSLEEVTAVLFKMMNAVCAAPV
jgi:hypothetical protein